MVLIVIVVVAESDDSALTAVTSLVIEARGSFSFGRLEKKISSVSGLPTRKLRAVICESQAGVVTRGVMGAVTMLGVGSCVALDVAGARFSKVSKTT